MALPVGTAGGGSRRRHRVVVQPNPDQRVPSRPAPHPPVRRPAPTRPSAVFGGPATVRAPFAHQQRQAQRRTDRARARLPRAPIATPPVIHNPSRGQVHAAARQITRSINRVVGPGGSNEDRIARRDALLREVRTNPRYARVKRSLDHWSREQARLINPGAFRDTVKAGPQPRRARVGVGPLNLATVNLTATGRALGGAFASATPGLHSGSAEAQFTRNALSDVGHLPLMVPQTAYEVSAAAYEAAHGDTKRAKELVKGLTGGVYGHLARGDFNGAIEYFRQHPVYAALADSGG